MSNKPKKKGQVIGETVALFAATVLIIAILVAFFFVIKTFEKSAAKAGALDSFSLENQGGASLKAYLATPVKIDYNNEKIEMKMADLIRLAKINESYRKILEDESREIFDKTYGVNNYRFEVKDLIFIGRIEYIQTANPEIMAQKTEFTDEVQSKISIPDFEITLSIKIQK